MTENRMDISAAHERERPVAALNVVIKGAVSANYGIPRQPHAGILQHY